MSSNHENLEDYHFSEFLPPPASQAIASADSRRITRRGRSRPSSGVFEAADSTDDDASARNRKKEHKGDVSRRRVSDFSLASMMLLMPNMDDFSAKGEKRGQKQQQQQQQDANEGSEQRPRGRDRTSRSRRAWRSTDKLADDSSPSDKGGFEAKDGTKPSPSSPAAGPSLDIGVNDVTDRWNQVARSSEQQWTEQSFRYKKSRSLSPYSRGIVGNLPPGNLDPNESRRVSIRSELSDNDTSTLRSSDETDRDSNSKRGGSKTKKKPNDTKIHPHRQGGLQGLWLVLPKRLRKRDSGNNRGRDSKAKGNDDEASLSPVEAQESGATDLEWGSLGPGDLHRSKSKREILREKAELNASKASLTGQGKLGDQMVMGREIKRRKFILRCCLVFIGLVLVLVIPLLLSVPGFQDLLPPRVAETMNILMHRLQFAVSYVSESLRVPDQQLDELGRPLDPTTHLPIGMEIGEPIENVRSRIPPTLQNMVDVGPGRIRDDGRGLESAPASPLIWGLENSGSQVLEQVFADCLGQSVASDLGGDEENQLYARETVSDNCDFVSSSTKSCSSLSQQFLYPSPLSFS